jgi:hypothetical protein
MVAQCVFYVVGSELLNINYINCIAIIKLLHYCVVTSPIHSDIDNA